MSYHNKIFRRSLFNNQRVAAAWNGINFILNGNDF